MVTPAESRYLLNELLRDVSRSFYLTLKFLPKEIRAQIGLAYLLARATDTIADTGVVPVETRLEALQQLQAAICSAGPVPEFKRLTANQAVAAEKILLERIPAALTLLDSLTAEDRTRIRKVLGVITSGQELDLIRFRSGTASDPIALETEADLEDYTWRVAGCVGEFWTQMCLEHLRPAPKTDAAELVEQGIRFGKGLQLVNILRDIPKDLRLGRCYIPKRELEKFGLTPGDLLHPSNFPQFQPFYSELVSRAESHLKAGWAYTNALPVSWIRLRLACAWPVLIGIATLEKLRKANVLDASQRVKTSRSEVKSILLKSTLLYPVPGIWRRLAPAQHQSH